MNLSSTIKDKIQILQKEMTFLPQTELPTWHYFADGMYCRYLPRPAGTLIVGKTHKREHFYMVVAGRIQVTTDDGMKEIQAPAVIVSKPGTKRAVLALEDSVCLTVHRTDKTDLDEIEKELIEEDPNSLFDAHNKLKFDVHAFRELTKKVIAGEKPGFWSDWTEDQQKLYTSGDWRAFSKSRGYSEDQIQEYSDWMDMIALAKSSNMNPFQFIADLAAEAALKNIALDTKGEILKSSHAPFEPRGTK